MSHWSLDLVVDPIACEGRGVCAEMLPERIAAGPAGGIQ